MTEPPPNSQITTLESAPLVLPEAMQTRLLALLPAADRAEFPGTLSPGSEEIIPWLGQLIQRESKRNLTILRALRMSVWTAGFVLLLILCWAVIPSAVECLPLFLLGIIPLSAGAQQLHGNHSLEDAAVECLISLRDRRTVGPLLEHLYMNSERNRARVREALTHLLPMMGPEDAARLTASQKDLLNGCLNFLTSIPELHLPVIVALTQFGDRKSINPLYRLAACAAPTQREQAVRAAAQNALHVIQARTDFGGIERIPGCLRTVFGVYSGEVDYVIEAESLYSLLRLVPLLTRADYRRILDEDARNRLYRHLRPPLSGRFAYGQLALCREFLALLARVGDTRAIPAVRTLARMEAPTDAQRQLRAAAKETLTALRAEALKEKESLTLLRGASAPDVAPEELLRAALPAESRTAPEELLRAAPETPPEPAVVLNAALLASVPEPPRLRFPGNSPYREPPTGELRLSSRQGESEDAP